MKYCRNCGNPLDDNAIFCPRCGARSNGDGPNVNFDMYGGYNSGYGPVYDTQPSRAIAVLSFIFWQVGLIIWFFCRRTRPGKAESAVKGALSSACVSMPLIGLVIWLLWGNDPTKRGYAKVAGISAIVGAGIYALFTVLSIVLILTGLTDAGLYFTLPVDSAASIFFR